MQTLVFAILHAFTVVNTIDILRYPLAGCVGTQMLFSLEYGLKYAAIVIICWYFIYRSSQLVKSSERERFKKWWTILIVTAIVVFILFIMTEGY